MNFSWVGIVGCVLASVICATPASGQSTQPFDGRRWNVSTGNLSTFFIQASPIGAHPRPGVLEPPPAVDAMKEMKDNALVAYEDYVAWGAVERAPGKWDWTQHDRIYAAVHAAGLDYVVYNWVHFPPVWLRDDQKDQRTLMRCLEHEKETNYLSIFDPKTIEHYDHFYKALSEHFGDKIAGVYACILGPYGEGNYPLNVPDWVNIGHCHEGYWCADPYAIKAFAQAMRKEYGDISRLNQAWGSDYKSFDDVRPPKELSDEKFKPSPQAFKTTEARRRWLDFITWYHQAIIDFAEKSIQTTLKYFPKEKVRTKPGGNAGGVNPIAWGTYCPGYAKMAGKYGIVLQPADCQGAVFGDMWVGTAYQFYHVPLSTEPASALDKATFTRRMFSDASAGAKQFFTYEYDQHVPEIRKYIHLYTGKSGDTQIAVLCPTTLYRLGGNLKPTIGGGAKLRDACDFDVLDELLVADGALTPDRYKTLILFQQDVIDQPILDKIGTWLDGGGTLLVRGDAPIRNVAGEIWTHKGIQAIRGEFVGAVQRRIAGSKGADVIDGVWTTHRGGETFMYNTTDKPVSANGAEVPAHEIVELK